MERKFKNKILVFLTLSLIICNMGNITQSFAQFNKNNLPSLRKYITISKNIEDHKPEKVRDLQMVCTNSTYIKLKWSSVKCATGYRIYRSNMKNGVYRSIGNVGERTTCYIDKELECGTNYYYKVRAYNKVGDKVCWGCYSDILDTTTCPCVVKYLHSICVSDCTIQLSWDMVHKSSGYEVYRSNMENGRYIRVATITDKSKTSYIDKNLDRGRKYYYKVRAFKELNGQVCFGDCSNVLCVCTKK